MPKGKTFEDFQKTHDRKFIVARRVQDGLKSLGNSWEYETDFIRRCRVRHSEWGSISESIKEHFVTVPGGGGPGNSGHKKRVVAGTKVFAGKLRAQLER